MALPRCCTLPSKLVKVPSFSAKLAAGRTTEANFTVFVGNRSDTARNSREDKASLTSEGQGKFETGFSPMINIPFIFPSFACSIISKALSPALAGKEVRHLASNFCFASASSKP